ncbi:hypothetical protein RR49_01452 [Microbacterium ginsengisoli]|uniref:DUF7882 domain-containing protein n=1 Tax=Microbacterium ginsengisoli TaxID=400772 RepID=A0A0F0LZ90_9MICO|nr:hypothetical protein [Microbacterium ginsengisoli]KJL36701.1 hypothetical protein RR49_01452 [Microbacterium ginsengisoli]
MGRFIYDTIGNSVEIEDRTLAHLRIVVMNKLRRAEPFMFDVEMGHGSGRRSFWVHPSVPLQFHFFGSRQPRINRAWVEDLMAAASGPNGLTITPEPAEEPPAGPPAD